MIQEIKPKLKELLSGFSPAQRKFLTLRIAGLDFATSLRISGAKKSAYDSWTIQPRFQELYRKREELSITYKDEAILLLREENYMAIIGLESEMIEKIRQEIKENEPNFTRTHLAREIYGRLAAEISQRQPEIKKVSWEQWILQASEERKQLGAGYGIIEAEISTDTESETSQNEKRDLQEGI